MFKKTIAMSLSVAALLCLAACGPAEDPTVSIPPAEITDQAEEFSKPIVPLEPGEGEELESPYYRIATVDGTLCYEVQVEGEDEPTQVPIDSVIYIVGSPQECKLEKVSFSYTQEGGEPEIVEQYRIYATSNAAATVTEMDPQDETGSDEEVAPEGTEAPADGEAVPEGVPAGTRVSAGDENQESAPDAGGDATSSNSGTTEATHSATAEPET